MTITIIATVFVFGLLVLVHELGHFVTAKLTGMRVDEFAIGFGPGLWQKKYGETLYALRAIPLGGYNKIAGMDPDEEQDERSFSSKPVLSRMFVIIAGSAMNLLLPLVLFTAVFAIAGMDKVSNEPVIGTVLPDKPAYVAGLLAGDRITHVNGQQIREWPDFVRSIQTNDKNTLNIEYERDGQAAVAAAVPEFDNKANKAVLGVVPVVDHYQPAGLEAVWLSLKETVLITKAMIVGLYQMVTGQIAADVAGPIGVAQMAGQVAHRGIIPLLQFTALLSINLGIINLLPVPVLDGGHVVALALEGVRGKPLSSRSIQIVQMVGLSLLVLVMLLATFKDVTRLNLF